jgi:membrane protease YdiL (CAAX protease family)
MARQVESTFISVGLLFAYAVWSYLYIRFSHFDLKTFGITMTNFKPALKLSLKMTLAFVVMLFVLKWILITYWPDDFGNNLIDFQLLDQNGIGYVVLVIGIYSFHAILQEFIARSCIQGGLMEFITGKWAEWKSIILATLMFSSFHIMIDIKYGFLTIAPGLLWGYLFYKNRNLLAVSISHIIIGIVALFVLNLMG